MVPFFQFLRHRCLEWIWNFLSNALHIHQHLLLGYWVPCLLHPNHNPLDWRIAAVSCFSCSTHCFLSCSAFNLIWTPAALTPFSFTDHRSPLYQGVLAPSTNHTLPRYSHGLLPRLQILSSHSSLPWTNYLILKLSGGIPHPPLLLSFSPDHIIPHTQFCLLSHPISQYIWNIFSL